MNLCVKQVPIHTIFSSFSVRIGNAEPMKPINVCKGGTVHSITWREDMVVGMDLKVLLYPSFNFCIRWRWVVIAIPQLCYPPESDPVLIVWEAEWDSELVWVVTGSASAPGFEP